MNTTGMKEYTCPRCKKPFTWLERSSLSVVLGVVIIFFSIPGILFGILFVFVLFSGGSEIVRWIFLIAPILFALYGLTCIRGKFCPNCGIKLRKVGDMYVAPRGINMPTVSEMLKSIPTIAKSRTIPKSETIQPLMASETYMKPAILTIIFSMLIPTLMGLYVAKPYTGSPIGNIVYIFSVLFLIWFVIVNFLYKKKIEDLSKNKLIIIGIVYGLVILLFIPIITGSILKKPPSVFLISLFFFYFSLALTWTFIVKREFTSVCIVLFILCLLPLTWGFYVQWAFEEPISDEIKYLENQGEFYKNHFDDLNYGVLTKDLTDSTKYDIRELKENIDGAKEDYLIADFSGARKKIEEGNKRIEKLEKTFKLLVPEKVLHAELSAIDKDLKELNSSAYDVKEKIELYHPKDVYTVERILSDINITKNKSDEAWDFFRNGEYEKTYEFIPQINADISDIKEKLDRIEILMPTPAPPPRTPGFETVFAIAGLLAVAYLLRRR